MIEWMKKVKKAMLIASVICLIPSLAMIFFPGVMSRFLAVLLGLTVLGIGVWLIVDYVVQSRHGDADPLGLVKGAVTATLGLLILVRAELFVDIIFVIIALGVLACSVYNIQLSVLLKRGGYRPWWTVLVGGIIGCVLSVFIMLDPQAMFNAVMVLAGVGILWNSLLSIYSNLVSKDYL